MSTVAEAKANIYNRLASFPTFNPSSASLFADWTLQGGDIITVSSGNTSYNVPVYGVNIKWNGTSKVNVTSSGKENRGSLQKMAERQASTSGYGYRRSVKGVKNLEPLYFDVYDESGYVHTQIGVEAGYIYADIEDVETGMRSYVDQASDHWSAKIQGVADENGNVTVASICVGINDNESYATIEASKIHLLGQTIANTITANYIQSKIADLSVLNVAAISATGNIHTSNGYIAAPYYYIGSGNSLRNMSSGIWALQVVQDGNTYKIQKQDWDDSDWVDVPGTFSRAVASWTMGWSNGTFTARANPQNQSITTQLVQGTPEYDGATVTVPVEAIDSDNPNYQYATGRSVYLNLASKLQDKTGTAKFTANGTYTAESGYIGYGQITIDVPQGSVSQDVQVRFNGSSGSYYIEAFDSVTMNPITGANLTYKLGLNGTKVEIQNTSGTKIGADYQIPLQASRTLTQNGTYAPSTGNVGIASVTVNVPSDLPNAKARFNVSSGQYYIEAFDNVSTNPISGSNVNYHLGLSGNKVQIHNTSNAQISNTPEYDISTLLTNAGYAGRYAVTLADPTWNAVSGSTPTYRTVTVSTSGRTDTSGTTTNLSKSVALYLTKGSWSNNKLTVFMKAGSESGTTYAETEVDASTLVTNAGYAGRAAVNLSDPTWNAITGSTPTYRTISVSTTGRTNSSGTASNLTKSATLYLTQGSWSSNKLTVFMRQGSTSGTVYAQTEVDASTLVSNATTAGKNSAKVTGPTWATTPASGITGNSNTATFTTDAASPVSGASKSLALYMTQGSWSSNKKYVYVHHTNSTDGNRIARVQVDASTLVTNATNAGKAAVTLNNPTWNSVSNVGTSRTVTVSTTGRTNSSGTTENLSKSVGLYLTQGSWSSNKIYVYMREGSSSGTARAQVQVDASSIYTNGKNDVWNGVTIGYPSSATWRYVNSSSLRTLAIYMKTPFSVQSSGMTTKNYDPEWSTVPTEIYRAGWNAGWNAFYDDSPDWIKDWDEGGGVKSVWTPRKTSNYNYYTNNGKGTGSSATCQEWFRYTSGSSYSHSASLYCYEISTGSSGVKTVRFSVQYSATQSNPFSQGTSYTFHW